MVADPLSAQDTAPESASPDLSRPIVPPFGNGCSVKQAGSGRFPVSFSHFMVQWNGDTHDALHNRRNALSVSADRPHGHPRLQILHGHFTFRVAMRVPSARHFGQSFHIFSLCRMVICPVALMVPVIDSPCPPTSPVRIANVKCFPDPSTVIACNVFSSLYRLRIFVRLHVVCWFFQFQMAAEWP